MNRHRFAGGDRHCSAILSRNADGIKVCSRTLTDPVHDLQEGEGGNAFATVQISHELLAQLQTWSNPVRFMIIPPIPGDEHHQIILERHECERPE